MDELLTNAYDELTSSVSPPAGARELVAARRTQRRRRRAAGYVAGAGVAVAAVVIGMLTFGGGESSLAPAKDPLPSGTPEGITCEEGGQPEVSDLNHPGYDSLTEMLTKEADAYGAFTLDRANQRIYFLREDRTAHTAVTWTRGLESRWFPSTMTRCSDSSQWRDVPLDVSGPSERVSIQVDHCYINLVDVFEQLWDAVAEDQFGTGGSGAGGEYMPRNWAGLGTVWRTGDVVTYVDDGGRRLTLVPEGDPWATEREPCD